MHLPLSIGPADLRKGPSRENDQANTHNEPEEYPGAPTRVKTRPRSPSGASDPSSGSHASGTKQDSGVAEPTRFVTMKARGRSGTRRRQWRLALEEPARLCVRHG